MPIFTRPRRSHTYPRHPRNRAVVRADARRVGHPAPTVVREPCGTVVLASVRASQDDDRASRLIRAEGVYTQTSDDLEASVCAWAGPTPAHDACVSRFVRAESEIARAQKAQRPAAVPFEAPRAPVTLPDHWPFPGSYTSQLRAICAVAAHK
jgi:hypothetical protein